LLQVSRVSFVPKRFLFVFWRGTSKKRTRNETEMLLFCWLFARMGNLWETNIINPDTDSVFFSLMVEGWHFHTERDREAGDLCGVFIRGVSKRDSQIQLHYKYKRGWSSCCFFFVFCLCFCLLFVLFGLLKKTLRLRKRQYPCCPN